MGTILFFFPVWGVAQSQGDTEGSFRLDGVGKVAVSRGTSRFRGLPDMWAFWVLARVPDVCQSPFEAQKSCSVAGILT